MGERLGNLMGFMARFRHGDNGDERRGRQDLRFRVDVRGAAGGKAEIGRGK